MESDFAAIVRRAKLRLLKMHYEAGVGHIGGNLSCLDALLYLYHYVLKPEDTFVLSKGHSAGALYVALWSVGKMSDAELDTFHKDGGLCGHATAGKDIAFSTGSLGHGLGLACGVALGNKLQGKPGRVYCMMSDGEWQEGSNWEAANFAQRNELHNLIVITDRNRFQGFGETFDDNNPYLSWEYAATLEALKTEPINRLLMLRLDTTKGAGVSFMENKMEWHYLPMNKAQYEQACEEVANA